MVKIERSFPAPESLALKKSYNDADVVKRLKQDFHNKCYICGMKDLQDPNVEHLLPHKNGKYPERIFDWNNLFWSCSHCNGVKQSSIYDEGILDCCKEDPEQYLIFELYENEVSIRECAGNSESERVVRIAHLIQEVFGKKNTGMRSYIVAERIRLLQREMDLLYKNLERLRKNPESKKHIIL